MNNLPYILCKSLLIKSISILLLLAMFSCEKFDEDVNYREPYSYNSNYTYYSVSEYYNSEGELEKNFNSEGELLFYYDDIYLIPKQGTGSKYSIESKKKLGNDTVAFMMPSKSMNEIYYNLQYYTLYYIDGVREVKVGKYGFFDGYYTSYELMFKFKSTNTKTNNWVITKVMATKK